MLAWWILVSIEFLFICALVFAFIVVYDGITGCRFVARYACGWSTKAFYIRVVVSCVYRVFGYKLYTVEIYTKDPDVFKTRFVMARNAGSALMKSLHLQKNAISRVGAYSLHSKSIRWYYSINEGGFSANYIEVLG